VVVTCEGLLLGCGISAIHMQFMFMLGRYFDPFSYPFFHFMFSPLLLSPPTSHSYSQFHYCYFLHIARKIIGLKSKSK